MEFYKVIFRPSVEKDLRTLSQSVVERVFKQLEVLKSNPFLRQATQLSGVEKLYRIRIGDYRVIYGVDKECKEVIVYYVRHRRDVYRRL